MEKMIQTGRTFVMIGLIAFGVESLIVSDFMVARSAAAPSYIPGRLIAVYASGFVLLITGVLMLLKKKAAPAAFFTAFVIFIWGFSRNVPQALSDSFFGGLWTNMFKTFAIGGGLLIIAASCQKTDRVTGSFSLPESWLPNMLKIGRFLVAIFLLVCGIQHFMFIDFVAAFIPAYIPSHYFWAYFTGIALIAGGTGLLIRQTAQLASLFAGVMIFLWVLLLHIPVSVMKPDEPQNWEGVCEALTISGILFNLAGTLKNKAAYGFQNKQGILNYAE